MSNPTSNYNFQMPTSTDLVTDLPADFEVFGQAVDTRLKALQPGTTLGDLAYTSASSNTNTRLGIGSTGQVLTVAGGVPSWATATSGSMTSIASGNVPTGTTTLSLTSISGSYTHLQMVVFAWNGSGNNTVICRLNNDTGANYAFSNTGFTTGSARASGLTGQTSFNLASGDSAVSGNNKNISVINIPFYTDATTGKTFNASTGFLDSTSARAQTTVNGYYSGTNAAVSRIDFIYGSNWSGGTYVLYGVN